jgi:hypothetical protein
VRVHSHLQQKYWGEIDNHVKWTIDNFNGFEFVEGKAQISLVPEGDDIRILAFGQITADQMQFVNDLFRKRGTLDDILIIKTTTKTPTEVRCNAGNYGHIMESKQQ